MPFARRISVYVGVNRIPINNVYVGMVSEISNSLGDRLADK